MTLVFLGNHELWTVVWIVAAEEVKVRVHLCISPALSCSRIHLSYPAVTCVRQVLVVPRRPLLGRRHVERLCVGGGVLGVALQLPRGWSRLAFMD